MDYTNTTNSTCHLDDGDTAWVSITTVLVLSMMPGLAFFEAGLLRFVNSVSIMTQVIFGAMVLCVMWFLVGFSLVFGDSVYGIIGNPLSYGLLLNLPMNECVVHAPTIPGMSFVMFQMMFAAITPLLQTGAFAERLKFKVFIIYVIFWELIVYYPVAHWVWGNGWLSNESLLNGQVLDFAGGIVIHTTAGTASFITALILGKRMTPHNKPSNLGMSLLGMALLWLGWFGFNAGSALRAGGLTSYVIFNTQITACVCGATWGILSVITHSKISLIEIMNGAIAGLAGITPASGFVGPIGAFLTALALGFLSFMALFPLKKSGIDDALEVTVIHGLTGILGALAIGLASTLEVNEQGANGLFFGGGFSQLGYQALGVGVAMLWSTFGTVLIFKVLDCIFTARVDQYDEEGGLDELEHGESAMENNFYSLQ